MLQAKQAAYLKREELKLKPSTGLTLRDAYKLMKCSLQNISTKIMEFTLFMVKVFHIMTIKMV